MFTALQTLVSRNISPLDSAVLTLGTVRGGKASNIICGDVQYTGTLRTLSEKTRDMLKKRIPQLAAGIAQHGRQCGGADSARLRRRI